MIFYIARDQDGRRHIVGTQADARAINKNFEQVDIPTGKAELMAHTQGLFDEIDRLNQMALDGVNMGVATGLELAGREPVAQLAPSYTAQSIAIDDAWEALPLPRKLHFAALAMEDARNAVSA